MSILDEDDIDVIALQKELNELREENQKLRQDQARTDVWKSLVDEWARDIDNLYHMIYGGDPEKNHHIQMTKITNIFSTKKGRLLLKFLTWF